MALIVSSMVTFRSLSGSKFRLVTRGTSWVTMVGEELARREISSRNAYYRDRETAG